MHTIQQKIGNTTQQLNRNHNLHQFFSKKFGQIKEVDVADENLKKLESEYVKYYSKKYQEIEPIPNDLTFIDLFCGAGGLSCGLEQAGLSPKIAVDKDKSALETYLFNRPFLNESAIINSNIEDIDISSFPHAPIVVGGPPCQGFSNANKQKIKDDKRNSLYKFFVNTLTVVSPKIFLMENVEGILKHIDQITDDFSNAGYTIQHYLLNTNDYGFPQNRKRVFILGISNEFQKKHQEVFSTWESSISTKNHKVKYTLWDAIGDLPSLEAKTKANSTHLENKHWGYSFSTFSKPKTKYTKMINNSSSSKLPLINHKSKYNNNRDINIYQQLPAGTKISDCMPELDPYKSREDIFKDKFYKLPKEAPSKTITAHMYYDCHMYIHPVDGRGLTPREAARIQGFPDDYLFLGTPNEWYRQVGNAVSPLLAKQLGKGLRSCLEIISKETSYVQ